MTDWRAWHEGYDDPSSPLSLRLRAVQDAIRTFLATAQPRPLRVASACSGLGLDLLGALEDHPRRGDVTGRLVELDPELAARSALLLQAAGLECLEVVCGDAGWTEAFASAVPADLLLLCGVLGNLTDDDLRSTVANASRLCAPGATVIWTRHRRAPDRTPDIREWWRQAGFEEVSFVSPGADSPSVGVCRLVEAPLPFADLHLFSFR
ncbi:MAG TPA: class I SAM-dependent methyltransferase [Mycobacteriales bacterium]|nr:class I SAM-dependent methyltransferase [Mycobacteriales bacterium]